MNPLLRFWQNLVDLIPPLNWDRDIAAAWMGASGENAVWTVILGTLVAIACGLIGCYLIVQRLSLIGDAISHTVFLGIVVAFLITGQLSGLAMFLGAALTGVLTTAAIAFLHRTSRVKEDAAVGIVFTTLFALGVVLLTLYARNTHLDAQHAIFGNIEFALNEKIALGGNGFEVPVAVLQMAAAVIILIALITLFYKELLAVAFDREWAAAVGLRPRLFYYGLMTVLSLIVVGSFTFVGAVLVVAMLVIPAATAYLLTDRLPRMFVLSGVCGAISSLVGFQAAFWLEVSTGGAIVCSLCGLFGLAFLFGPHRGLVSVAVRRARVRWRTAAENVLRQLLKLEGSQPAAGVPASGIAADLQISSTRLGLLLAQLRRRGLLERAGEDRQAVRLTPSGTAAAQRLDRAHRLWETYLVNRVGLASDHVHPTAEELEHLFDERQLERLDDALGHPDVDPHGTPIPRSPVDDQRPGVFTLSKLRVGDRGRIVGLRELAPVATSAALTSPTGTAENVAPLQLTLGESFEVRSRETSPLCWKVVLGDGRELLLGHREADSLLVQLNADYAAPGPVPGG